MRHIHIEAVAQSDMREPYNQEANAGDWFVNRDGDLVIRVIGADFGDAGTFLFALHELIEAKLCQVRGIGQEVVDAFDRRAAAGPTDPDYPHSLDGEPGDLPGCPYRKEHREAMLIEHLMAKFLGIDDYGVMR